jgi:ABC-type dipeptide/oligopeptide/nickel transport system permease component
MGLTVATALVTLVAGVLADVLYALADPRVRLGEAA